MATMTTKPTLPLPTFAECVEIYIEEAEALTGKRPSVAKARLAVRLAVASGWIDVAKEER
jgi:hypothetical protein